MGDGALLGPGVAVASHPASQVAAAPPDAALIADVDSAAV